MKDPKNIATAGSAWLVGGGEMGRVVRAKDWSKTPLGPIESWPQSLRTTVSLALASNFPISLAWGPGRVQIYNDGYWPICAAKHPQAMGQDYKECWFSAWPVIGEAFERASAGETCFLTNQRMYLDRLGYLEETFFTFSFSPIRDESGGVGGLFHPVTELTQQSLAERRLGVLRDIADRSASATSIRDGLALIVETLRANALDVPFALFYRTDADGAHARFVERVGLDSPAPLIPDSVDLLDAAANPWPFARVKGPGASLVVEDLAQRFGAFHCGPYEEPPRAAVIQPILLPGLEYPYGFLVTGVSSRRPLDDPYRTFYDMLGQAVSNALAKARAYEEERQRAEALAELDRAKTAFFSNVSHEFRTPLTLMLGPLETLLARSETEVPPSVKSELEVANRNGLRLLRLVNGLLDFSRIEAGRAQASYQETDLSVLTAELASGFRSAIERAGMKLVVDCPPLPGPVYVDRDMWEKVVLNLVSNAFKFTFEGEIAVSLRAVGSAAELRVRDTGTGIPAEAMPRLFERFYRVEGAHGRTYEGSGIGLALVQELVKLHGGIVTAESEFGRGTTFVVRLPFGRAHLPQDRIGAGRTLASTATGAAPYVEEALRWLPETTEPEVAGGQPVVGLQSGSLAPPSLLKTGVAETRARVLVADDNADMRQYIVQLLSPHYDVRAVADGEAALNAVRHERPDLVLSDIMMPRMDGFGLLRAIREDPSTATLPVVLLSARAGEESRVEGLDHGADDYLVKPFSARELIARVDVRLEMARIRREAEHALRESAERLRFALETGNTGAWDLDLTNHTAQRSPEHDRIFGYPELLPEWTYEQFLSHVVPEDRERVDKAFRQAVATQTDYRHEHRIRRADGEIRWLWAAGRHHVSADGKSRHMAGIVQDVTERKRAEEQLRESEERFHTLADNMSQLAWMADGSGSIFWFNKRWHDYTGESLEQLRGWGWRKVHHPEYADRVVERLQRSFETGTPWQDTFPLRGSGGQYRWFLSHAMPVRDEKGRIVRWFGTHTDVTEQRAAEEALREADRRKNEFLAVLGHELRNPLAPLTVGLQVLDRTSDPGAAQKMRWMMKRQLSHLVRLIDDLLDVSRISRGKIELRRERVDLAAVLQPAVDASRPLIEERGHVLDVRMPRHAIFVFADPIRLSQVFTNLLTNAAKFTKPGGRIEMFAEADDGKVRVHVRDSGIGIPEASLGSIFDLFVQGPHEERRPHTGLGIGLFLVRGLVELHGGSIEARSEGSNEGSEFIVTLPAIHETVAQAPEPLPAQPLPLTQLRILVVDDNRDATETLRELLIAAGNEVFAAFDGEGGLALAEGHRPDVALLDIGLPGMDGYELCRRIRTRPWGKSATLIAVSGWGQDEDRKRSTEAGFDLHLVKPLDPDELLSLLSRIAAQSAAIPRA